VLTAITGAMGPMWHHTLGLTLMDIVGTISVVVKKYFYRTQGDK